MSIIKFLRRLILGDNLLDWTKKKDAEFKLAEDEMWEQLAEALKEYTDNTRRQSVS